MTADLLVENLAAHWMQSGLLAAVALGTIWLLKLKEPRFRIVASQLIVVAIVGLPLFQKWQPLPAAVHAGPHASATDVAGVLSIVGASTGESRSPAVPEAKDVLMLVLLGSVTRLLWLGYGVFRLMRFSQTAVQRPRPDVAVDLESRIGVAPRYVEQMPGRGPCTFGVFRSTIALPRGYDDLPPSFQRAIVCHELLHARRRDMAIALLEEIAVAILWFHPWVWLLRARIRIAREQVVDRNVVTLVGDREEYVRCLVEIAGHDLAPHLSQAGAGMLRPIELRARIDAILQEAVMSHGRLAAMMLAFLAVVGGTTWVTAWAVPLRAPITEPGMSWAQSAQATTADVPRRQTKMGFAEYPVDALEKGIRGAVMVAITVNPSGQVTIASIVSGPQELRASAFKAAMGLEFSPAPTTTAMTVFVNYFLTPNQWGVRIGDPGDPVSVPARWTQYVDATGAYRIGGSVQQPRKIADVPPNYPEEAQRAQVEGIVVIEARVDENGNVSSTRLLQSVPLLDEAAIEAVSQWKYEPPLRDGERVPVFVTVTVNFSLRNGRPGTFVRLNITLPEEYRRTPGSVSLLVRAGDMGVVLTRDNQAFAFVPLTNEGSSSEQVRIGVYRVNPDAGPTPQALGSVEVAVGGGTVQTPTMPSFGVELVSVDTR